LEIYLATWFIELTAWEKWIWKWNKSELYIKLTAQIYALVHKQKQMKEQFENKEKK